MTARQRVQGYLDAYRGSPNLDPNIITVYWCAGGPHPLTVDDLQELVDLAAATEQETS